MATHNTADRVEIVDGLKVWDNDLHLMRVDFALSRVDSPYFDGWFTTVSPNGSSRGYSNGERMATVHPFTGQSAESAWNAA